METSAIEFENTVILLSFNEFYRLMKSYNFIEIHQWYKIVFCLRRTTIYVN